MGNGMMQGEGMMGGNQGMMQGSFLPARDKDINTLPAAKPTSIMEVQDGDTITLNPELVRATINGKNFALYAYNGEFPGPTLKVKQGSTFTVNVTNNIDVPTTIHWHGIRLENRFDGAAGVTQEAIEPGKSFTYTVKVPDDGMKVKGKIVKVVLRGIEVFDGEKVSDQKIGRVLYPDYVKN
jgi:FtsP/CotA-like multicopper oxidase with cupredoxin domain